MDSFEIDYEGQSTWLEEDSQPDGLALQLVQQNTAPTLDHLSTPTNHVEVIAGNASYQLVVDKCFTVWGGYLESERD